MSVWPRVTAAEAQRAAADICARRTAAHDPDLHKLPDEDDFWALLSFVRRCQRVPDHILRADALDALTIASYIDHDLDHVRLSAIGLARRTGLPLASLAVHVGKRSAQSMLDTVRRLEAAVAGETKDVRPLRAGARQRKADARRGEEQARTLRAFLARLQAYRDTLPADLAEDVDELEPLLTAAVTPAEVAGVREIVRGLRAIRQQLPAEVAVAGEHVAGLLDVPWSTTHV